MKSDSVVVEEVRQRAMAIGARYDHDLRKYAEHLRGIEREHQARVVDQVTVLRCEPGAASDAPSQ